MTYPERKAALARAILAHPTSNARVSAHDGLLTYSSSCPDSARQGGYEHIQDWTDCRHPILLAQELIDGRCVALFDVSE
jgi:hypothetical protein